MDDISEEEPAPPPPWDQREEIEETEGEEEVEEEESEEEEEEEVEEGEERVEEREDEEETDEVGSLSSPVFTSSTVHYPSSTCTHLLHVHAPSRHTTLQQRTAPTSEKLETPAAHIRPGDLSTTPDPQNILEF
ncbi:unnamed protein product [Arctogadus glacialis]